MKVTSSAVAASILSSANLCSARNIIESVLLDLVPSSLGSTFRVPQVHNENFVQHGRGPRAVAKTYQKYGVEIPDNLVTVLQNLVFTDMGGAGFSTESDPSGDPSGENSKANVGVGEVSAIPEQYDSEYLAAVQIGTPPQTLCLDFDTASSDLWVFSSATPLSENHGQKIYNSTASSTAKELPNTSWFVSYGDASSSSGNVYTDVVSVAGVTVAEQAVETAYRVSGSFTNDTASSGVMGLAFSILNQVKPVKQKTFFENAMPSLAMPLFTVNLKKGKRMLSPPIRS